MRVIVVNKFWYRRGGLETLMFDELHMLEAGGHTVAHFSTDHPANDPSPWSSYFAPYIELGGGARLSPLDKARAAGRLFHNGEAARRFSRLVDGFGPDLVHAHGTHRQMSPSVLSVAHRRGIPVVETLHDFHHICPADTLLRSGTAICEPRSCGTVWYGAAVRYRCRESLGECVLAAAETSFQSMRRVYQRCITRFVSPSAYLERAMVSGGWSPDSIDVLPNPVSLSEAQTAPGDYFLCLGRVSPEKGVRLALTAAESAGLPMVVAGDGSELEALVQEHPDATFAGWVSPERAAELLRGARALVLPSVCAENAPLAVLEAMSTGVAIIASSVGGVPELVRDGKEALLVPPGDTGALAEAMRRLSADADLAATLGAAARKRVEECFSPEMHYEGLMRIYERALAGPSAAPATGRRAGEPTR